MDYREQFISALYSSLRTRGEERGSISDPGYWPGLLERIGMTTKTISGANVSADTALNSTVVFACIRVLAETLSSLPLMVYRRLAKGGKEPAVNHHLYPILHDAPNDRQTAMEFIEMLMGHLCLRGNAYAFIEKDRGNRVLSLNPLDPTRTRAVIDETGTLYYEYKLTDGTTQFYPRSLIWHIKGLSSDGIVGLSPVTLAREAIGLSISAEEHGGRFFSNAAQPAGLLEYPGKLNKDVKEQLKKSYLEATTGENMYKLLVLEGGLKWTQIGLSNEDSQFIEVRNFQIQDIARIFRVPSILIGHPDNTTTYASAEQQFLSFVMHTIRPWCVRWEQSILRSLIKPSDPKGEYFASFKIDGLLRGDMQSRFSAYATGRQWGWMSADDIRELENMNPLPGGAGKTYLQPMNMVNAAIADEIAREPKQASKQEQGDDDAV